MGIHPEVAGRKSIIHSFIRSIPVLKYAHTFLTLIALAVTIYVLWSLPHYSITILLLFLCVLVLLITYEAFSVQPILSSGWLNGLTLLTLVLGIGIISTSLTLLILGVRPPKAESSEALGSKPPAEGPVAAPQPPPLPPIEPMRVISSVYHSAGGCEATGRSFAVGIPDAARLDGTYRGVVSGIEFQETTHVSDAGFRNVAFGSGTLTFDLFANGAGSNQDIPFLGRKCIGAAGASIGYNIVAHYK